MERFADVQDLDHYDFYHQKEWLQYYFEAGCYVLLYYAYQFMAKKSPESEKVNMIGRLLLNLFQIAGFLVLFPVCLMHFFDFGTHRHVCDSAAWWSDGASGFFMAMYAYFVIFDILTITVDKEMKFIDVQQLVLSAAELMWPWLLINKRIGFAAPMILFEYLQRSERIVAFYAHQGGYTYDFETIAQWTLHAHRIVGFFMCAYSLWKCEGNCVYSALIGLIIFGRQLVILAQEKVSGVSRKRTN